MNNLRDLCIMLQEHFDNLYGCGSVSAGYDDEKIYVYEHVNGVNKKLPDGLIKELDGIQVEFKYVGKIKLVRFI